MHTRTPLASELVLAELLWYGGEQKSRKAIAEELRTEGHEQRMIDWYLFCLAQHQPGARQGTKEGSMIGNLVEHILETGCDVSIRQHDGMLVLRITKMVGENQWAVDWSVARVELAMAHYEYLQAGCDERLQFLRDAIAMKHAAMETDPKG